MLAKSLIPIGSYLQVSLHEGKDIEVPSRVDGKRRNLARVSDFVTQNHSRVQDSSSFHPRVIEPVSPTIKRRNLNVLP